MGFQLQIAIMGCIMNGLGEMADANFGYVGGSARKIHLYVGKVPFFSSTLKPPAILLCEEDFVINVDYIN